MVRQFTIFFAILLTSVSCVKLNPDENNDEISINGNGLVLVGNEGNFQYGNASLSTFNKLTNETNHDVYKNINQLQLGDVLHDISHIDHELYLVINNSGKIIIIDDESFVYKREIDQLNSPRKIIKISNSKFYITDLYANKIHVYNSYENSLDEIKVSGWCEDLKYHNGKVYVCNVESNLIYVINANNNIIIDSISVNNNPKVIQQDNLSQLWILSGGSRQNNITASISLINPESNEIIREISLPDNESSPKSLRINNLTNEVYFLNNHVYKIDNIDNSSPQIIWENTGENFYNLEIDPYSNDIYLTDAKDYVQRGSLLIIDNQGNFKKEIPTEIIPKSIVF